MTTYTVHVQTEGHEIYLIEANTPETARAVFEEGLAGRPQLSEVLSAEVEKIEIYSE